MDEEKVIIIGGGAAGLTAAVYAARADLRPLVFAGYQAGGQLMLTTEVENFPGFPDPIMGPDLMQAMRRQAERFGARVMDADVESVDFTGAPLRVTSEGDEHRAHTVIIATGANARWLGIPSEQRFIGRGVSSCATCDGAFFRDQKVAVIGGGDSAMEEALYLARIASNVTVIHRRDELRASKIMQARAIEHPKIDFIWNTVVDEVLGDKLVTGLRLRNVRTEEVSERAVAAMFVAIGHTPNTQLFEGQIDLDEMGYVVARDTTRTSRPNVFVAGDVEDTRYRQAVTAAGAGCKAAIDVARYLEEEGI
ncbi:MAG TPA: thioredoxin-disulfide reductase [Dehalococcoidia bacterium]|nr:thioredoxin-disulfide reductase [Dehalococcoidia bacterium]